MGNIRFLSVPGRLRAFDRLTVDLQEVTERRFQGYLEIIPDSSAQWWDLRIDAEKLEWPWGAWDSWGMGKHSQRRLGAKHVNPDFLCWTQTIVFNELGVLYQGRLSDEGSIGTWAPDVSLFPTFESYVSNRYGEVQKVQTYIYEGLDPRLRGL